MVNIPNMLIGKQPIEVTRVEMVISDRPGTPTLRAKFDVILRECKLLQRGTGEHFVVLPPSAEIVEASIDALAEFDG